MVYPKKISERARRAAIGNWLADANAEGVAVNFECGSFVRFQIELAGAGMIGDLKFRSNGCGYMMAAADVLAANIRGTVLGDLHGLDRSGLRANIEAELGLFSLRRSACLDAVIEAVRAAFAELRRRQIEEFQGEKALICTCFGVTEETIDDVIISHGLKSLGEVAEASNAGSGCGSCRMLIQEILDGHNSTADLRASAGDK